MESGLVGVLLLERQDQGSTRISSRELRHGWHVGRGRYLSRLRSEESRERNKYWSISAITPRDGPLRVVQVQAPTLPLPIFLLDG